MTACTRTACRGATKMTCCRMSPATLLQSTLVRGVGNNSTHAYCVSGCYTMMCCRMSSATVYHQRVWEGWAVCGCACVGVCECGCGCVCVRVGCVGRVLTHHWTTAVLHIDSTWREVWTRVQLGLALPSCAQLDLAGPSWTLLDRTGYSWTYLALVGPTWT